jgi:spore germination protein KB
MRQGDRISRRQFVATAFVAALAPLIRRFPGVLARSAGRSAWFSVLLSAIPVAALIALLALFFRKRTAPTGFSELLCDALGTVIGRALTVLYALWFLFYAGFLLRAGAFRFVSTVYPDAKPWIFIAVTALLCLFGALGSLQTLARTAMIFRPLLVIVFSAAVLLTLKDLDFGLLLPVTAADLLPDGVCALETAGTLSVASCMAFLGDRLVAPLRPRDFVGWAAGLLVLLGLLTASCIGMFGPELTAKLSFPFFMLVRDMTVLGALERTEPMVIALWVFLDFTFVSLLLQIAAKNLRESFGFRPSSGPARFADLSRGRWLIPVCAALSVAAALLTGGSAAAFDLLSETVVPRVNALMICVLPLPALLIGLLRRRI